MKMKTFGSAAVWAKPGFIMDEDWDPNNELQNNESVQVKEEITTEEDAVIFSAVTIWPPQVEAPEPDWPSRTSIRELAESSDDTQYKPSRAGKMSESPPEPSYPTRLKIKLKQPVLRLTRLQPRPCPFCARVFYTKSSLQTHQTTAHASEKALITCEICTRVFTTRMGRNRHMQAARHSKFVCRHCQSPFNSRTDLTQHVQQAHPSARIYPCEFCGRLYLGSSGRSYHKRKEHLDRIKCSFCNESFRLSRDLQNHINEKHCSAKEPNRYKCRTCRANFDLVTELRAHENESPHGRCPRHCTFCRSTFTTVDLLKKHMDLIHLNGPRYKCQICREPYNFFRSFKTHMRRAHEAKVAKGPVCGETYLGGPQDHFREKHSLFQGQGQAQKFPYECTGCNFGFQFEADFEAHTRLGRCKSQELVGLGTNRELSQAECQAVQKNKPSLSTDTGSARKTSKRKSPLIPMSTYEFNASEEIFVNASTDLSKSGSEPRETFGSQNVNNAIQTSAPTFARKCMTQTAPEASDLVVRFATSGPRLQTTRCFVSKGRNGRSRSHRLVDLLRTREVGDISTHSVSIRESLVGSISKSQDFMECGTCKRLFGPDYDLSGHKHEPEVSTGPGCHICKVPFASASEALLHKCKGPPRVEWRLQNSSQYFECSICESKFLADRDLLAHECGVGGKIKCSES